MLWIIVFLMAFVAPQLPMLLLHRAFPQMEAGKRRKTVIILSRISGAIAFLALILAEWMEGVGPRVLKGGMNASTICTYLYCCPSSWLDMVLVETRGIRWVVMVRSGYALGSWGLVAVQLLNRRLHNVRHLQLEYAALSIFSGFSVFETYLALSCKMAFNLEVHLVLGIAMEVAAIISGYLEAFPEVEDNISEDYIWIPDQRQAVLLDERKKLKEDLALKDSQISTLTKRLKRYEPDGDSKAS